MVPLDPAELEAELQAASTASFDPVGWMKTWLDHHHHSYYKELESAALLGCRAAGQQAAQGQQGQAAGQLGGQGQEGQQ